jgi:hydroxyacylglutathione hydrolase
MRRAEGLSVTHGSCAAVVPSVDSAARGRGTYGTIDAMEHLTRSVGPLATNVHILADPGTREAIAIDTAIPSLDYVRGELDARGWTLKLIVSTHGHWDHIGDNAALAAHTGAPIAVHALDRERLEHPNRGIAPFDIPPSVPAVELAEGGVIRFGELRLDVLHTPGHTAGSVSLLATDEGLLFSGDTLFAAGWGRVDLPGGSPDQMAESLARLARLEDQVRVFPGHGTATTIGRERAWLDLVSREGRLFA